MLAGEARRGSIPAAVCERGAIPRPRDHRAKAPQPFGWGGIGPSASFIGRSSISGDTLPPSGLASGPVALPPKSEVIFAQTLKWTLPEPKVFNRRLLSGIGACSALAAGRIRSARDVHPHGLSNTVRPVKKFVSRLRRATLRSSPAQTGPPTPAWGGLSGRLGRRRAGVMAA